MKKANEIISHILLPFENKVNKHRCLRKIISLMPQKYKNFINSVNLKGETLYIWTTHPAIRQELYFRRKEIFDIINLMHKYNVCKDMKVSKIVTLYKYTPPPPPLKEIKIMFKNPKTFENKAKNPEIKKLFDEIKEILSANKD